jgi:hypothetical protein
MQTFSCEMNTRLLTQNEKELITKFAMKLSESERHQLLADMVKATALSKMSDGSQIRFEIADYSRPDYHGQHLFGVEGRMSDCDGIDLTVLLYADENNRLFELEFIRWDSNDIVGPKWGTLRLVG